MRFLVTGAAGFIGSHLCDALLADGHSVVGVDNLLTGSAANLKHLENQSRFEFHLQDICLHFDFGPADCVLHFASPASPVGYMQHGIATLRVGAQGTLNALEFARRYGAKLLFASTSEVYGDPLVHPQAESYWGNVNPIGPRSVYDEGKRFGEAAVMAYHRYHALDTRIVRIFNTYGTRMNIDDGRVIPNFMKQALRGEPLTIYGDGRQTRSFCYVSDLVDGILRVVRAGEHLPVNLGNPAEFTMLECARVVLEVTGSTSQLQYRPLPEDDPKQRRPDITRARTLLQWEPRTPLADGLRASLAYFREQVQMAGAAARSR
jgi:dTDP-glucose 4,6-dehydratase